VPVRVRSGRRSASFPARWPVAAALFPAPTTSDDRRFGRQDDRQRALPTRAVADPEFGRGGLVGPNTIRDEQLAVDIVD